MARQPAANANCDHAPWRRATRGLRRKQIDLGTMEISADSPEPEKHRWGTHMTTASVDHNFHRVAAALNPRPTPTCGASATARITGVVFALLFGTALAWSADAPIGRSTSTRLQRIVEKIGIESGAVGGQVSVIVGAQRADFVFGS